MKVTHNLDMATGFLARLGDGPYQFQVFAERPGSRVAPETWAGDGGEADLKRLAGANAAGAGAFVCVNQTDGRGRRAENVTAVRAVFVDLDGAPLQPVLEVSPRPQMVVESSPGRHHAYWLVRDVPLARFQAIQKGLADRFDGDAKVKDLPRVLRIPGFLHQKGDPFLVRMTQALEAPRYTLAEVERLLPAQAPNEGASPPPRRQGIDALERCRRYVGQLPRAVSGEGGHDATLRAACECFRFGLSEDEARSVMREFNSQQCDPPWREADLEHKLDDAWVKVSADGEVGMRNRAPASENRPRGEACADHALQAYETLAELRANELTELASARRLVRHFGEDLRHDRHLGWLVWDGQRWAASEKAGMRRAQDVGRIVREEVNARNVTDPNAVRLFYSHALSLERERGCKSLLDHAKALEGIDVDDREWDQNPWLFNCGNGTLDLRTGAWSAAQREHYITRLCRVNHRPEAPAPRWERFISEVFNDNRELVAYVQQALGYALSGSTSWQAFFVLHGDGANGKSTLVNVMQRVLGEEYAQQVNPEQLLVQKSASHTTELAALRGARFVAAAETSEGRRLNESFIKALSGGDRMRARYMRMDSFEFRPQLKLFLATNHRPDIRDDSGATWRRTRLIPFERQFRGEACDPKLEEKLMEEAEGILAWLVRGAVLASGGEPEVPKAVRAATAAYRADQDVMATFLEEECVQQEALRVGKTELYEAYNRFTNGRCESRRSFSARIGKRGFGEGKLHGGRACWVGLGLRMRHEGDGDTPW